MNSFAANAARGQERLSPTRRLLNDILSRVGLEQPDGRPFYNYRLTTDEYIRGREILQKSAVLLGVSNRHLCAIFALVTAEWYRREATSLWRQWSDIGVVPVELGVAERGEIVETGLAWWSLPLKQSPRGREFLLSLALNGGLPSALIVGETGSKVRRFFEDVMNDALTSESLDAETLANIADKHAEQLPESYRDSTIYELTAELIRELVACRAALPNDRQHANPAAWLDRSIPGWRERLPIHLPDDAAACNRLFNDLLTLEPKAKRGGIGLRRIFSLTSAGTWAPGFLIQADGALTFDALKHYSEGRFRAFFAGSASQLMSREFAQLYRSEDDKGGTFEVTARAIGRPELVTPVSFSEPVSVVLSRDGQALPTVCWPGGQARVSNCYVLKPTDQADRLELIGTGSLRSSLPVLFVVAPTEASVLGHQGGSAECVWRGVMISLWRVEGMALVESSPSERYRIQAGADETDERRLDFNTIFLPDITLADRDILVAEGPLRPRMLGLPLGQSAPQQQLRWSKGGRQIAARDYFAGLASIAWQDEEGFLLDRAKVLVLPRGFSLDGLVERRGARIRWRNMPGWKIEPIDSEGLTTAMADVETDSLLCLWPGEAVGNQRLKVTDPEGTAVTLSLRLRANRTLLVDAAGRIRDDSPELSPADLRGAMLMVERPSTIDLDLRGAGNARALLSRRVEGNTPMVRFGDLAQRLLGLSEERGPSIIIQDDQRRLCIIKRSGEQPCLSADQIRFASTADADTIAVARPLLTPDREHALVSTGAQSFALPPQLQGPCLVYRRKGDAVVTRPVRTERPVGAVNLDTLARLALISDEPTRRAGYSKAFVGMSIDPSAGGDISKLIHIVQSLRGLSPRAMDVTREMPGSPALLCRLLLAARAEHLESILGLERDLPFLWMALPVSAWSSATQTEWERGKIELGSIFDAAEAQKQAFESIRKRLDTLADRTEWFAGIRSAMGFPGNANGELGQLVQDHIKLHGENILPVATGIIDPAERLGLPQAISSRSYHQFPTLLAPVVLAGLAKSRITMTPNLASGLRDALDADQTYVSAAFPHCLKLMKS